MLASVRPRIAPILLALTATLAIAYALSAAAPLSYVATARVLLPEGHGASRVLKLEQSADDPMLAANRVRGLLEEYGNASVIDQPAVLPARRNFGLHLSLAALLGLGLGIGFIATRERRRRPVRHERDLLSALGPPLLAARPLQPEALRTLCRQLLEHWFSDGRCVLPVVSLGAGEGRSRLASQLAVLFAEMGERTLLIDADLRAPSLHAEFGLPNRHGLADLLDGRTVQLAAIHGKFGENLALLVAGSVREDPLELLSRDRLRHFLSAAARPFRVVLIDTPAAERGPDFEIFAALAGGALLVLRPGQDATPLGALKKRLERCSARLVATVLNRR